MTRDEPSRETPMSRPPLSRTSRRIWVVASIVLAAALVIALAGSAVLNGLGRFLVTADPIHPAELAVITPETGGAGELEAVDLFRSNVVTQVGVLLPQPTLVEREFERRGVRLHHEDMERLVQSGVPRSSILTISAGEGGTTDSSEALSTWGRSHPGTSVIVIVSPTHARRFRRALRRAWNSSAPLPTICITRFDAFRPDDWWRERTTLREGIVELEKLALDLIWHPF